MLTFTAQKKTLLVFPFDLVTVATVLYILDISPCVKNMDKLFQSWFREMLQQKLTMQALSVAAAVSVKWSN